MFAETLGTIPAMAWLMGQWLASRTGRQLIVIGLVILIIELTALAVVVKFPL